MPEIKNEAQVEVINFIYEILDISSLLKRAPFLNLEKTIIQQKIKALVEFPEYLEQLTLPKTWQKNSAPLEILIEMKALVESIRDAINYLAINQKKSLQDIYLNVFLNYLPAKIIQIIDAVLILSRQSLAILKYFKINQEYYHFLITLIHKNTKIHHPTNSNYQKFFDNSLSFEKIFEDFETINIKNSSLPSFREVIGIWREHIGGFIIFQDDLMQKNMSQTNLKNHLILKSFMKFLGDLILAFHLIKQGLNAENQLLENPQDRYYYRQIASAEYFIVKALPDSERSREILQREISFSFDNFLCTVL